MVHAAIRTNVAGASTPPFPPLTSLWLMSSVPAAGRVQRQGPPSSFRLGFGGGTIVHTLDPAPLVARASAGDQDAWAELVSAYSGLVWAIARNHRLGAGDAADVSQTTWLRLVENIQRIQDPSRVGAWLATTARRECLRLLGKNGRMTPLVDSDGVLERLAALVPDVDSRLLESERCVYVRDALRELPLRSQMLMHLLMLDPPPSYEEVSAAMGMPVGSIGPTRGRCLVRLQQILHANGIAERPPRVLTGDSR
jgi:RNA polymerase sigma factor (sigma-70 family)